MTSIKSVKELNDLNKKLANTVKENESTKIQIKVAISTCSIAAGAKEVFSALEDSLKKEAVSDYILTQTGCMGYCYCEPTVEVTMPGKSPVVFKDVDRIKSEEIVEKYIIRGESISGMMEHSYLSID